MGESENRYWEVFGVEPTAEGDGGEDNRPSVARGDSSPDEGSLSAADDGGTASAGTQEKAENSEGTETIPQSALDAKKDEVAKSNEDELRRAQELEQRIRTEMQERHDAQLREIFGAMGLKDKDGNPITTMEAYQEHQRLEQTARLERDLKAGRLTTEGLQSALANLPGVRETVEAAQRVQQEAQRDGFIARREVQLAEIRKLNPNVRSLNDIVSMETGKVFIDAVNKGLDYVEAYKLANHDSLVRNARAAGEQAVRNASASKSHLQQTVHNAKGGVEVTQEMRERYRRFASNITDAQIAAAEAAVKKG